MMTVIFAELSLSDYKMMKRNDDPYPLNVKYPCHLSATQYRWFFVKSGLYFNILMTPKGFCRGVIHLKSVYN